MKKHSLDGIEGDARKLMEALFDFLAKELSPSSGMGEKRVREAAVELWEVGLLRWTTDSDTGDIAPEFLNDEGWCPIPRTLFQ